MGDMAVYAAVRYQSEHVQGGIVLLAILYRRHKCLILKEIPVLDGLGDPGQLLVHDPACAHV